MATTTGDSPDDQAEEGQPTEERQESFWDSFTRADMRLFLITFAGTVAANVVTVMVVAIAIILARLRFVSGTDARPATVLTFLALFVFNTIVVGICLTVFRRKRGNADSRAGARDALLYSVTFGLSSVFFLLVLLGYAVGVK